MNKPVYQAVNLLNKRRKSSLPIGVGILTLICVAYVVYFPSEKMGFRFVDDYTYVYWAGTMPLSQYLSHSLDPRVQSINYRPLKRIFFLIEYNLFRGEARYYHLVQNVIHIANALLVFAIVRLFSNKWQLSFLAALFYVTIPVASEAVFWISDETPLATFFSLGALLFWVNYIQSKGRQSYLLAVIALVLALLCKESAIVIPIALVLLDRLLVRDRIGLASWLRRYGLVAGIVLIYLSVQFMIQRQGTFTNEGGYFLGWHILSNYAAYLAMLVFPWGIPPVSADDIVLWILGLIFIGLAIFKRKVVLISLTLFAFLAIGPVVLASLGPGPRYLYLATVPLSVLWALGIQTIWTHWRSVSLKIILSLGLALLTILNGWQITKSALEMGETARQQRVPFRDIMRQYPEFPPNTRLFLIEPPHNLSMMDVAGMFFLQYGKNVSVSGTFADGRLYTGGRLRSERARLSDYSNAYVYYFDEMNRPIQVPVQPGMKTYPSPTLPIDFQVPIRLEGYELTSTTIKKGETFVVILYWRAIGNLDKDLTVFTHLVDAHGQMITGDDSYPRNGKERTSLWSSGRFTVDAHILTVSRDVPSGKYRLEVGLYYLPTMQRILIVNEFGTPITDKIMLASLEVVE